MQSNILGHGIDLLEIEDFRRIWKDAIELHLSRYFTLNELKSVGNPINKIEKLAGRFAIKEAVLKAMGTGWGDGIAFTDVEVISLKSGAPSLILHRKLFALQKTLGITKWVISMSHSEKNAIASVIAIAEIF